MLDLDPHTGFLMGLLCKPCHELTQVMRDRKQYFANAIEYLQYKLDGGTPGQTNPVSPFQTEPLQTQSSYAYKYWKERGKADEIELPSEDDEKL